MSAGLERPAHLIYTIYHPLCHQLPFRSWYLFGTQFSYSIEEISRLVGTVGLVEHGYIGDAAFGFKVALCQRDVALYGTIFLTGLVFGLTRRRWRPMPGWAYFLFGIVPIGLDGGLQMVYYIVLRVLPSFDLPSFESNALRRTVTGVLFGLSTVWLAYPYVQEAFSDILKTLENRFGWK
jgi:uncharacterized membrane protein